MKLTQANVDLWEIARNAGFTPRELSRSREGRYYFIEIETLVPNAIALCYTGEGNVETIVSALRQLHALGIEPSQIYSNSIHFLGTDHPVFLDTKYVKTTGEFNREEYNELISSLSNRIHVKKNIRSEEIIMYMQASERGVAPRLIQVLEDNTLITHRYPYSLSDASVNNVWLSLEAKLSLESKMHTLHSLGILHGDITEENFVCNLNGTDAYIIDFGLSIRVDAVNADTLIGYIKDFEEEELFLTDMNELVMIAKKLEIRKLARLLKHF